MSSIGNLFAGVFPSMKDPDAPSFRRLARETATYAGALEGYQPYLGDHEAPDRTSTEPRARIVFERVLAVEAERSAEITALLERQGLKVAPTPEAWGAIGRWCLERLEGSREPGTDRYSPYIRGYVGGPPPTAIGGESTTELRPVWRSVAFDLGLLLGRHMIEALPGGRWVRDGEQGDRKGSVQGQPMVAYDGQAAVHQPFASVSGFLRDGLLVRLGLREGVEHSLGYALRRVTEASEAPPVAARQEPEEFFRHLRQHVSDNGALPEDGELGWMLSEHGLDDLPALPPDLAKLSQSGRAGRCPK